MSNQAGERLPGQSPFVLILLVALVAIICESCSVVGEQNASTVRTKETNTTHNHPINNGIGTPLPAPAGPPRPKILSRQEWKAKAAVEDMWTNLPKRITIHHTASPQKGGITLEKKMQNLQKFSQSENRLASGKNKPVWPDVPYHYLVALDGQIAEGRDVQYVGDTNTNYDPSGHILVVLEGNFEMDQPLRAQIDSLVVLIAWLSARFDIPVSEVKGHNDYAATVCPGPNLKNILPTLRQRALEASRLNR